MEGLLQGSHQLQKQHHQQQQQQQKALPNGSHLGNKQNQVGTVLLYGIPIVSLVIESQERLCLAQISNTLLKQYSYNEIHNRRVALGITCVQCTPVQLEILRRAGAMPVSSRRCGMITRREAERLCKSFLGDNAPPRLPDDFAFSVHHECAWGCRGAFLPSRYNSSRAKCIKCTFCGLFFSPNKFIFHSHRTSPGATYVQPDAANFNSWRRHMKLSGTPPDDVVHAWEDVKAMFNGGTRKRLLASSSGGGPLPVRAAIPGAAPVAAASTPAKQMKLDPATSTGSPYPTPANTPIPVATPPRVPPFPDLALPISVMDYVWQNGVAAEGIKHQFPFAPYAVPWFGNAKRSVLGLSGLSSIGPQQESLLQHLCPASPEKLYHHSAFRPVFPAFGRQDVLASPGMQSNVIKRQAHPEELLLPKKKYSREADRPEGGKNGERPEGEDGRRESGDKENELRKSELSDGGSPQGLPLRTTFKREQASEASDDSEEPPRVVLRPEGKDLLEVSRLLSIKPNLLQESVFKFREFSPNLLEAISGLKAEDRGACGGLAVKLCQEGGGDAGRKPPEEDAEAEDEDEDSRHGSRSEEDDEPVDVETTDDPPAGEAAREAQDDAPSCPPEEAPPAEAPAGGMTDPETEKPGRIWTVARFSLEQRDCEPSTPRPPGFCSGNDHGNPFKRKREAEALGAKGGSAGDRDAQKTGGECLGCCRVSFGSG